MKLAIVTPAVKKSAIGRMASLVTKSLLAEGHEVIVIRADQEILLGEETHNFCTRTIRWNDVARVEGILANWAESIIYQIGDNYPYHKGCLELLPKFPGIVCLHDFFLGDLFNGWSEANRQLAEVILTNWYGSDVAHIFFRFTDMEEFIEGTRNAAPLTEWVCSMATGVVTHSSWGVDRILRSCPGPVEVVPLAYDIRASLCASKPVENPDDRFRVLTIGHVNTNKRSEEVIRAIGSSPILREKTVYQLVGFAKPAIIDKLTMLAGEMGVHVAILGEVDEQALADAIDQADVVSCLRWPPLEAASASAIEAMLHGKPTLVTDIGFFSEIPDACAVKIDHATEIASLRAALEQLYQDPGLRLAVGNSARQWAEETFSPDNYARQLAEIACLGNKAQQPIAIANNCTTILKSWGASDRVCTLDETLSPLRIFTA